jgi:hypothetical protein
MKIIKTLAIIGAIGASLMGVSVRAQSTTTTPPVVVDKDKDNVPGELKEIKALIKTFDAKRDAYLDKQRALLAKLKNATTDAERDAIREKLQDNRQAFLAELRAFRTEVRHELVEIKHLINNAELERLLDQAEHDKGGRHKGQN